MEVTFLGSADAWCAGGYANTAVLVRDGRGLILVDCGPTTPLRLAERGLSAVDLDAILITHAHGDHFGGLPFLLLADEDALTNTPVRVFGPPGLREATAGLLTSLYPEASETALSALARFHTVSPRRPLDIGGRTLLALPADHMRAPGVAYVYRLRTEGRVVAFTGDTGPRAPLEELAADADMLVCECTLPRAQGAVSAKQHLRINDVQERILGLGAKRIVLVHLSEASRREAAALADVVVAEDGDTLRI